MKKILRTQFETIGEFKEFCESKQSWEMRITDYGCIIFESQAESNLFKTISVRYLTMYPEINSHRLFSFVNREIEELKTSSRMFSQKEKNLLLFLLNQYATVSCIDSPTIRSILSIPEFVDTMLINLQIKFPFIEEDQTNENF